MPTQAGKDPANDEVLQQIAEAIRAIRYGQVIVKIEAGQVKYIDKFERERVG